MSWIWVPALIAIALCAVIIKVLSPLGGAIRAIAWVAAFSWIGYIINHF